MPESDDDHTHVVAAESAGGFGVGRDAKVAHHLTDFRERDTVLDVLPRKVDALLALHHVPDPVAREHHKLVFRADGFLPDVREAADHLVFRLQRRGLLELKIPERTRKREAAIHSPVVHEPPCSQDALPLELVVRLVVFGEVHRHPVATQHAARVSRVRHHQRRALDRCAHRRAPSLRTDPLIHLILVVKVPLLRLVLCELPAPLGREHLLVERDERLAQGGAKVFLLVRSAPHQRARNVLARVMCNLPAPVPVEHPEQRHRLINALDPWQLELRHERVLHRLSPPLHGRAPVRHTLTLPTLTLLFGVRLR
mmetsp:Transcript_5203/g.18202  ORF Transcript_5203/g.18202 Transcript_5203/m.18202 type:complete len:311 (-) Transcript_5203:967-1899(-)